MRTRFDRRKLGLGLTLMAGIAALWFYVAPYLNLEWLVQQETVLRERISGRPLQAWVLGFLVFLLMSLVPGTKGKAMVFGWFYGLWAGLLLVNLALTAAALISFAASRYLLRDLVRERFGAMLYRMNRALERDGGLYLLTLRAIAGIPFSFVNYAMGASSIRTRTFWWATQLGILPGNLLFVYVGSRMPTLNNFAHTGLDALLAPQVVLSFAALALAPFALRALVRRLRPLRQPVII